MRKESHLETYAITLTTLSPTFIGSNTRLKKTEYCYYPALQKAVMLDREKFFAFLVQKNLMDAYEQFIFGRDGNLAVFLQNLGYGYPAMRDVMLYATDAGDALDETRSPPDIDCFLRDAHNRAYIPGSSLKGALRTALLIQRIDEDKYPHPVGLWDKDSAKAIQKHYFYKLNLARKRRDEMLNDILRTVSISDSEPIENVNMTLCRKLDISPKGFAKKLPVVRECVRPGVKIRFALTIDTSFGRYISVEDIRAAVAAFAEYYNNEYIRSFPGAKAGAAAPDSLFLGGGSGFFTKSAAYPLLGREKAVREVSRYLQGRFRLHRHEQDVHLGISPRTVKCTSYRGQLYPFGLCRVEIS